MTIEKVGLLAVWLLGCVEVGRVPGGEVARTTDEVLEVAGVTHASDPLEAPDPSAGGGPAGPAAERAPDPPPGPGPESLSPPLTCGLRSPMPGGFTAGYAADTGLDLAGIKMPVFAVASGRVVYAEPGHSLWSSPRDTDLAVLLELDEPLAWGERRITHVWYAHLSELAFEQPEGSRDLRRVAAGERLGTSGVANGAWHLHLGLLLDGDTSQRWGSFLLEDEVRRALCGLRARQRLPPKEK